MGMARKIFKNPNKTTAMTRTTIQKQNTTIKISSLDQAILRPHHMLL